MDKIYKVSTMMELSFKVTELDISTETSNVYFVKSGKYSYPVAKDRMKDHYNMYFLDRDKAIKQRKMMIEGRLDYYRKELSDTEKKIEMLERMQQEVEE